MENLLTITEAAEYLNVHPNTLRRWERDGVIEPPKRIGIRQERRWTREALDKITYSVDKQE